MSGIQKVALDKARKRLRNPNLSKRCKEKQKLTHFWLLFAVISRCSSLYQPHIVFCMVDDMGWNDVSFHGSDQIQTPNIDNLAYQGVILQQYYSEAVCTPARTALLTGKYPMRLGMQGFPLYNSEDRGIPVTERLLPSYLKELGYATHLVGKWHVGQSREEYLPTARGYDTHYGMRGGFIDYYTYNKVENWPNGRLLYGLDLFDEDIPQVQEDRYIVDALTDRAINVIKRHNTSQPLFLHLTHNAPHSGNAGGALQPPLNSTVKNNHIAHSDRRLYAEVVSHLDKSIGRVIKALADKQILDETIIIFQSDNGAPTTGDLANLGVNLPFRGKKYTPWEGGVRVPAVIWHSSLKPSVWQGLMHITDWLPTLISAAGGQVTNKIDGINQWESIIQKSASKRTEVLVAVEDFYSNYAAYRAGDYKIIVGNVTGVSNGYYGEEFMANRNDPPPYFPVLKSCDTAKAFESLGIYLDVDEVKALRSSATIKQYDPIRDNTPCVPTPSKGCLYNVRRDPTESHDLWQRASKIAALLTNRLRSLLTSQLRRGPPKLDALADPALYDYIWLPWINRNEELTNNYLNELGRALEGSPNATAQNITLASLVECNGTTGFTNLLCLLRTAKFF